MLKHLTVDEIRHMEYSELEPWWEGDFESFITTAIAEATGEVRVSVREALVQDDWIEQWLDALYAATGELDSSRERLSYKRSPRLKSALEMRAQVVQRKDYVSGILRDRAKNQGFEMMPVAQADAMMASISILSQHHRAEFRDLREEACRRRGIPLNDSYYETSYADAYDSIRDAITRGALKTPETKEVRALLDFPYEKFKQLVAEETKGVVERCDTLRHPLVLQRWEQALDDLAIEPCRLIGVEPRLSISLPKVLMKDLWSMPGDEAWKILDRRRFIRGLAQRHREFAMHKRQVVRAVALRREADSQPWIDAAREAQTIVGERHPKERDAIIAEFLPYCEPGSTRIIQATLPSRKRGALVRELKEKLASGTIGGEA